MHSASQETIIVLDSWPAPPISVVYSAVGMYTPNLETIRPDLCYRLTQPLNKLLGRRGTIFFACIFSILSCLAQAFSKNWRMMVAFRILLGLGIGPKSATIPIYASECAPANIRGALVMFWQFFTAFGIMMGYLCGAAFRGVLHGTDGTYCIQPDRNNTSPRSQDEQVKLLALRCVSVSLIIEHRVLRTLSTYQDVKPGFPDRILLFHT